MAEFILDDVNELLLQDRGDRKLLEQIKRAAQSGEVISIHERNYVTKLAEEYLRKKPFISDEPKSTTTESPPTQPQTVTTSHWEIKEPRKPIFESKIKNEKTTKIAFALGGIALSIILIIGLTQTGIPDFPEIDQPKSPILNFEVKTDLKSYTSGDIISISGNSDNSLGNNLDLSIRNAQGNTIWQETIKIKENGSFSTLAIAGGSGWENAGEFSVLAQHENKQFQTYFTFKN